MSEPGEGKMISLLFVRPSAKRLFYFEMLLWSELAELEFALEYCAPENSKNAIEYVKKRIKKLRNVFDENGERLYILSAHIPPDKFEVKTEK